MNKKVLKVMIGLVVAFLVADYVLKFFFPEEFVMMLSNPQLISFGAFVDKHLYVHMCLGVITSSITYVLYVCATTRRYFVKWYELLLIFGISVFTQIAYYFIDIELGSAIGTLAMFILPTIGNATLRDTAIVYTVHHSAQWLSTKIRGLPMLLPSVNYATILALTVECYFWLLLFYLLYNINNKRRENNEYSIIRS